MSVRLRAPFAAVLLLAAIPTPPQPVLARQAAFVVDLHASGGFVATPRGGVTIGSDGTVRLSSSSASRATSACSGRLDDAERLTLFRAVSSATLHPWPPSVAPAGDNGCCDRPKWTLRVHAVDLGGPRTFVTTWFSGNEPYLPKDLASIRDIAGRALDRTRARCRR